MGGVLSVFVLLYRKVEKRRATYAQSSWLDVIPSIQPDCYKLRAKKIPH